MISHGLQHSSEPWLFVASGTALGVGTFEQGRLVELTVTENVGDVDAHEEEAHELLEPEPEPE